MTETLTYDSAGTLQEVVYQGITGQKYTSTDDGLRHQQLRRRARCGPTARP